MFSEPVDADPVLGQYTSAQFHFRVFDQLVTMDPSDAVVPNLAASWSQPDPTTYIFKLRDDVKFSNGRPLRASDVVKSFQRLFDPKTASTAASRIAPLKEVSATDDLTVRFDLKQPHGPFLPAITRSAASILPMKELEAGTYDPKKDWLGSGPFVLKEMLKGESFTFARNPGYWRAGLPKADELVMLIVPDLNARVAALRTGRADIAIFDNIDSPQLLKDVPNVSTVIQTTPDYHLIYMNAKTPLTPALKDLRVRQAINLSIDRDQIVKTAMNGLVKPMYGTIPGSSDGCDASKLPKRDVAKAKSLLAEAGATGLAFELLTATNDEPSTRMAQVIQQNLGEAGIGVKLQALEQGAFLQRLVPAGAPQFDTAISFTSSYGDNWLALSTWSTTASTYTNKMQLDNPAFDTLLDKTRAMAAGPERGASLQQMCGLLADAANLIPLTSRFTVVGYRSDRVNVKIPDHELHGNVLRYISEFSRKDQ